MKIKVSFYLNNQNSIDCTNIHQSNPGLGGSEYLSILVPTLLTLRCNDLDVTLYSNYRGKLPSVLKTIYCRNFDEYASMCLKNNEAYCVVNYTSVDNKVITAYPKVQFIIWCHNFVSWKNLNFYSKQKNVVRLIAVGREQLDLYRDHPAFDKSDFIYNAVPTDYLNEISKNNIECSKRENGVVYVGSLVECKGFLHLAKAWKKVIKLVPDANLYIIGGGNLYDEKAKLGKYGYAEENFEKSFMKYLTDEKGILPSVHFMGIMGDEKFDIIKRCKVGVPNPGGITETFGLTAVEMQAMGCKVTTIKCPGYLDTVFDKKMLYESPKKLSDYIIHCLMTNNSDRINPHLINEYVYDNFSYDQVIPKWHELFTYSIPNRSYLHKNRYKLTNDYFHLKKVKELLRRVKQKGYLKRIPAIERILYK